MACVILRPVKLWISLVPASCGMLWREFWNSKPLNKVPEVKLRSVRWRKMLKKEHALKCKQLKLSWQRIRQCQNEVDARYLDSSPWVGNVMVFEPRSHDGEVAKGIAVGKALLLTKKIIMNLTYSSFRYCSSVSSIVRKLDGAKRNQIGRLHWSLVYNTALIFLQILKTRPNGKTKECYY
ncbi:hypothetical protein NQ318_004724 [Aromia moschata]|uniref:Uncharacterized protein n=1 Tax=Aromia moschata TaxID=1265417 RepID=A0AAV8XZR3_9CUCU|nr:hypothetical protein NQ318_004724 [Aromia moschata]